MSNNANFVVKNGLVVNGAFTANSTTVNAAAVNATTIFLSTTATVGNVVVNTSTVSIGTNVNLTTSELRVGNSTVNTSLSSGSLLLNGVNVNTAITGNATSAYSNAITIASNATNLTTGTLATARLPATVNVATVVNVGANVGMNTTSVFVTEAGNTISLSSTFIRIGNSTVNTALSAGSITLNGTNVNTAITSNAATAYANATSFATTIANTAYSNAISIASNATNLTTGTVPTARLSGTYAITANNATNLNGQAASFYTDIPSRLGYTPPQPNGTGASGTWGINITGTASGNFNAVQNIDEFTNSDQGAGRFLANTRIQTSGQTIQLVRVYTFNVAPVPPGCFPSYSSVTMADGSIMPIDSVRIGDKVLDGYGMINTVIAYHKIKLGTYPMYTINKRHQTTQEHRHWTTDGWTAIDTVSAAPEYVHEIYIDNNGTTEKRKNTKLKYSSVSTLKTGMTLITSNGPVIIDSLEADYSADPDQYVYTLVCDGSHTCLVNDIVVSAWARDDDFDYTTWTARV